MSYRVWDVGQNYKLLHLNDFRNNSPQIISAHNFSGKITKAIMDNGTSLGFFLTIFKNML